MSRLLPLPVMSAALALSWIALNELSAAHVALAVVLAVSIPLVTRQFLEEMPRGRRPLRALQLLARVVLDVVVANVAVARLVLGHMDNPKPAFVEVPLALTDRHAITLLATIVSMTPGTVSSALSPDARTLYVHALSVDDSGALVTSIKDRYESLLMEIFEC